MSVYIYHLVGCLPFSLFRLDVRYDVCAVCVLCVYGLAMCLSTHTEYITLTHWTCISIGIGIGRVH